MAGYVTCSDCKGSGEVKMPLGHPSETLPCGSCFGHGEVCDQCAPSGHGRCKQRAQSRASAYDVARR